MDEGQTQTQGASRSVRSGWAVCLSVKSVCVCLLLYCLQFRSYGGLEKSHWASQLFCFQFGFKQQGQLSDYEDTHISLCTFGSTFVFESVGHKFNGEKLEPMTSQILIRVNTMCIVKHDHFSFFSFTLSLSFLISQNSRELAWRAVKRCTN